MAAISNRVWFQLHGWCSLPVWAVFCFVCLTGTISVLSHELTWLTNPNARAVNPDHLEARPLSELVQVVSDAYPTADISAVLIYEPYLVNAVMFTDKDKPFAIAYVNQYSAEIQEVNDGTTFIGFMRSLHGWLLFPWHHNYSIGYYLVCAMAILMLVALITGLMVYKKFWRAFFTFKLRLNQGSRTLLADLHRLCGVWSIWFLIIMSVTGLWYLVQAVLWHNDIEIEPYPGAIPAAQLSLTQGEAPAPAVSLASALQMAQQRFDHFTPSYIAMPEHNRDSFKISGHGDFIFYDTYSYNLAVNPWNGQIENSYSPETMTGLQTVMHLADPLHYGTFAGIWSKILWFIFGLLLTGMSISGFMMWRLRLTKMTQKAKRTDRKYAQET